MARVTDNFTGPGVTCLLNALSTTGAATGVTLASFTGCGPALARQFRNATNVPGVIISQNVLFALTSLGNGDPGNQNAPNASNTYYSVFFPTLSVIDQFLSYPFDPDAVITIEQVAPLPATISYLDINFYLRGSFVGNSAPPAEMTVLPSPAPTIINEWNGTISETISSYWYGLAGITGITFGCNKTLVTPFTSPIVRTTPLEYTQRLDIPTSTLLLHSILFRASHTDAQPSVSLSQYFRVTYRRPTAAIPRGPYYTLAQDGITQNYITALKGTYPINTAARAAYAAYVATFAANPNLIQEPVVGYFADRATTYPGPIDTAYRALTNNVNILFDNRACTYNTYDFAPATQGDRYFIIQYNHKLEAGRCQYGSVTVYNGNDNSLVQSYLTLPTNGPIPTTPYLLVEFVNNATAVSPAATSIGIGERIYQYPAPAYTNTQMFTVFRLPFNPANLA